MHNSSPWPEKDGLKCKERIKIRCPIPSVLLPPSKAPVTWGLPRRESEKAGPCTISERKRKQHNKTRMSYGSQAPKTRDLIFVELFSWSFQVKNPTRLPTPNFLCPWLLCPWAVFPPSGSPGLSPAPPLVPLTKWTQHSPSITGWLRSNGVTCFEQSWESFWKHFLPSWAVDFWCGIKVYRNEFTQGL